jgi:predicted Zn-dependent protease
VGLSQKPAESVLLKAMQEELNRSMVELGKKGDPPPYFIGYSVTETRATNIAASYGALTNSSNSLSRLLNVSVRVGSYQLDNTHKIRGDYSFSFPGLIRMTTEDDPAAIRSALWLETDRTYKEAVQRLIKVRTNRAVKVTEQDTSADFSQESPQVYVGRTADISVDRIYWEKKLRLYSELFKKHPSIYNSNASFTAEATNKYFVDSENSSLQTGDTHVRLSLYGQTKASDGMDLYRYESFDGEGLEHLPDENVVLAKIQEMVEDLNRLRGAPLVEPYTGPAILSGKASGVFFHEIFGHRVEGHRQKSEEEGQTFTKRLGEKVLPEFISVHDEPTLRRTKGIDLNGYYEFDDEGVKAERVVIVDKGILKNFLMSRCPVSNFSRSNGHGRSQAGYDPVSRQGNLIIESSRSVPYEQLRQMLIDECKKQSKPYGLIFKEVEGGFTFTGRVMPNSFNVRPIFVYRVYSDGRPDEVVRGVDIVGTPLVAFGKILATSDDVDVFNGYCGAESGSVPVSAVSPSILVSEIEIQKKEKSQEKPPILPPPLHDKTGD